MSALNAIEMSAFFPGIESPFCLWQGGSHVYRAGGRRLDRDEPAGTGPVEGVVRGAPGRTAAEGGGPVVAVRCASSSAAGAANRKLRRPGADSPFAWSAVESGLGEGTAAESVGR